MSDWMSEHIEALARQEEEARKLAVQQEAEERQRQAERHAFNRLLKQAQVIADGLIADTYRMLTNKGIPLEPLIAHSEKSPYNSSLYPSRERCDPETTVVLRSGWVIRSPDRYARGSGELDELIRVPGLWIDDLGKLRTADVSMRMCMHPEPSPSWYAVTIEEQYPQVVWAPEAGPPGARQYPALPLDSSPPHCSECGPGVPRIERTPSHDVLLARVLVVALRNLRAL